MKKSFKLFLAMLLIGGFALSFSSCKDSENANNDPNSPENAALSKESESALNLLSVLSYTSGLDSLPDNWASNSYTVEPNVGVVKDESTPYVRYIVVNDKQEAIDTYNAMGEKALTEDATSDTWNIENVGSLSFKVLDQPDVTATLDINIKQQPHLTQIRFVPASAMGDNGLWGLKEDPYYQFGDVVALKEGDITTYWICARPCSKYSNKKQSHWFSFHLMEKESKNPNIIEFTSSNYGNLKLPTKLGNKSLSAKHIPNLFKLLMLIDDPTKYQNSAFSNGLGEIKKDEFTQDKLQNISLAWSGKKLWDQTRPSMSNHLSGSYYDFVDRKFFQQCFNDDKEVNVFYNGYSYSPKLPWSNPTVWMVKLSGDALDKDLNKSGEVSWKLTKHNVNLTDYVKYGQLKEGEVPDGLPSKGFIIRYKSGAQLANANNKSSANDPEPGKSFQEQNSNIEDVYTYKKDVVEATEKQKAMMGDIIQNPASGSGIQENEVCVISAKEENSNWAFFISNTSETKASKYGIQDKIISTNIYIEILNAIMLQSDYYKEYIKNRNKVFSDDYAQAVKNLNNAFKENCGKDLENVVNYSVTDLDGKTLPSNITANQELLFNITFPFVKEGYNNQFRYATLSYNTKTNKYSLRIGAKIYQMTEDVTKAVKITSYKDAGQNGKPFINNGQKFIRTIQDEAERVKMQNAIDNFASTKVEEIE